MNNISFFLSKIYSVPVFSEYIHNFGGSPKKFGGLDLASGTTKLQSLRSIPIER